MTPPPGAVDLLIVGRGGAALAAWEYAASVGAVAGRVREAEAVLCPLPGGWEVAGQGARAVLLAGPRALAIWQAAGGAVVVNPVLGRGVPVPGALPGVEVAGAGLGVEGAPARAKSGRFRARKLLRALARLDSGA